MEIGSGLVVETVDAIVQGNAELRVQRSFIQGAEVLKPAPKLTRELCHIDWNDSTEQIYNLIRGLSPYPTAFTEIVPISPDPDSKPVQLKIYSAERMTAGELAALSDAGSTAAGRLTLPAPGTILSDGKSLLAVVTADGAIRIKELQLAGKKRMDVTSFLLGFREPQSYACTPGTSKAILNATRP